MKKTISLFLVVLLAMFLTGCKKKTVETNQNYQKKTEQINKLAIKDRPFVTLTPRVDGKEVTLEIDNVKNATKVDYELEYQTKDMIQGAFGNIDFNKEPTPVSKNILFGSCSKGVCKYDEGVSGGSLTLRFEGGTETYVLKSDFNLQNMFDRQGVFASKDVKATLDVGKSGLPPATYLIISSTMGLPKEVEGEIIAGPYAFLAATSPTLKATLTVKSSADLTGAKLMFWTGKAWTELKSTIVDGSISAPVTNLGVFVVTK